MAKRKSYYEKMGELLETGKISSDYYNELIKEHLKKLEKNRKYEPTDEIITSIEELLKQDVVYMYCRTVNRAFVLSQQLHTIIYNMKAGRIRKVKRKEK